MIDYNVHIFQEALKAVFDRAWEKNQIDGGEDTRTAKAVTSSENEEDGIAPN